MDYFKHKHWRELAMSENLDYDSFDDVLTSLLDDVIDFEKTGFIKTSDDLYNTDRLKLFLFQIVNSKYDSLKLKYRCSNENCMGEFDIDINLLELKEIKLNKKIDKLWLDDEKKIFFKIPTRGEIREINKNIIYYKENVLKFIREKRESIEDEEELKLEIKKILDKFYLESLKENILEIKIINDIDFDRYTLELVALMGFIGGIEFNTIEYYLDYIYNNNTTIYKKLTKYIEEYNFGYDNKIKFKCKHCGKNYEEDLPLYTRFFFM